MGDRTGISWTDSTWNPWVGCQRVSPGCGGAAGVGGCYAEVSTPARVHRAKGLELWGPPKTTERHRTSDDNWKAPAKWDREAAGAGTRRRVFVASLCDVFEDHPSVAPWRERALGILATCANLDVQLLTKRPENVLAMVPASWLAPNGWPVHVWIGCTVEDQKRASQRIPHLLAVPALVRFLSCEPLLEAVDLSEWLFVEGEADHCECDHGERGIIEEGRVRCANCGAAGEEYVNALSWVIVGGESGPGARPFALEWARSIVSECAGANLPCFVKQMGDNPVEADRVDVLNERGGVAFVRPLADPDGAVAEARAMGRTVRPHAVAFKAHHGADPGEWPADLRVQRFPEDPR